MCARIKSCVCVFACFYFPIERRELQTFARPAAAAAARRKISRKRRIISCRSAQKAALLGQIIVLLATCLVHLLHSCAKMKQRQPAIALIQSWQSGGEGNSLAELAAARLTVRFMARFLFLQNRINDGKILLFSFRQCSTYDEEGRLLLLGGVEFVEAENPSGSCKFLVCKMLTFANQSLVHSHMNAILEELLSICTIAIFN